MFDYSNPIWRSNLAHIIVRNPRQAKPPVASSHTYALFQKSMAPGLVRGNAARIGGRNDPETTAGYLPEHACGGSGKIRVVEDFLLATAQPKLCGLKLRNCCMKSEHSISATSAKCRSQSIWFLNLERNNPSNYSSENEALYATASHPRIIKGLRSCVYRANVRPTAMNGKGTVFSDIKIWTFKRTSWSNIAIICDSFIFGSATALFFYVTFILNLILSVVKAADNQINIRSNSSTKNNRVDGSDYIGRLKKEISSTDAFHCNVKNSRTQTSLITDKNNQQERSFMRVQIAW